MIWVIYYMWVVAVIGLIDQMDEFDATTFIVIVLWPITIPLILFMNGTTRK